MIAVSLDCTGAFDCVGFDAASDALITKGVPKGMTLWYTNLLKGRKVAANLQGVTQTITPGRGNPQGGFSFALIVEFSDGFFTQRIPIRTSQSSGIC